MLSFIPDKSIDRQGLSKYNLIKRIVSYAAEIMQFPDIQDVLKEKQGP